MTKDMVEEIVKRYPYIIRAVKEGRDAAVFSIGNRKKRIAVGEETKAVCSIIEEIREREKNRYILKMIEGLKRGESDVAIIQKVAWERNAYYERKKRFIEKIYKCCIGRHMVAYEDILAEEIQ